MQIAIEQREFNVWPLKSDCKQMIDINTWLVVLEMNVKQ